MARPVNLLSAVFAATLALAAAVQAQASAYDRFDAAAAAGPAERLVLCDTANFLSQHPDLNADRIVVRRVDRIPLVLLPPQFVSGGFIYSERYERVFDKLRASHQASLRDIAQAQAGPGRAMVDLYRTSRWVDKAFVARQDRYCRDFAAEYGIRGGY